MQRARRDLLSRDAVSRSKSQKKGSIMFRPDLLQGFHKNLPRVNFGSNLGSYQGVYK